MRTLADIRRRMIPGVSLLVLEQTKRPVLVGTIRTISSTSTSSLTFTSSDRGDEEFNQRWPKARDVRIIDADTFEYELPVPARGHTIRLRFIG